MILRFLILFFIISSCSLSPGFKKEPTSKSPKKMGLEQNGVSLMFYNLNKINDKKKKYIIKINYCINRAKLMYKFF